MLTKNFYTFFASYDGLQLKKVYNEFLAQYQLQLHTEVKGIENATYVIYFSKENN